MKYKNLMAIAIFGLLLLSQTALKAESDTVMTKNFDLGGLDGNTVRVVKFSPDGNYVYAAISGYNPIKIKTTTGDILMTYDSVKYGSQLVCSPMDLSTDGQWLIVAQSNDFVWIIDTETGEVIKKLKIVLDSYGLYTNFYEELAISPNKKYVASVSQYGYYTGSGTASRADLTIWDVDADSIVHTQQVDLLDITPVRLKFTPDNKYLIIGHTNSTDSARIEFLNVGTWDKAFILPGHSKPISDLFISPDGCLLASGSSDGYIKIWNIANKSIYKFYKDADMISGISFYNNNIILGGGSRIYYTI